MSKTPETKPAPSKAVAKRKPARMTALGGEVANKIRAEARSGFNREHADVLTLGRFEGYRRALLMGSAEATLTVIEAAQENSIADMAVREHIAELIDLGRDDELSTQLRAYAVKCLVAPIDIMRRHDR